MSDVNHWLVLGQGDDAETFIVWDAETADEHRANGYRVDGPFVPAELLAGAVEALRHIAEAADHPSLTVRSTSYLGKVARDALDAITRWLP